AWRPCLSRSGLGRGAGPCNSSSNAYPAGGRNGPRSSATTRSSSRGRGSSARDMRAVSFVVDSGTGTAVERVNVLDPGPADPPGSDAGPRGRWGVGEPRDVLGGRGEAVRGRIAAEEVVLDLVISKPEPVARLLDPVHDDRLLSGRVRVERDVRREGPT